MKHTLIATQIVKKQSIQTDLKYEQLINEAIEHNDEQPVNAWDAIASETQHEQYDCE